jgi:hypothetical protein
LLSLKLLGQVVLKLIFFLWTLKIILSEWYMSQYSELNIFLYSWVDDELCSKR